NGNTRTRAWARREHWVEYPGCYLIDQ
ncbi:hypothetical protein V2A99_31455, partial [Pseudomonas aeruginosa]